MNIEMTQNELKLLASRKKQILDVYRLRVSHGDLSAYQRIQAEVFLEKIRSVISKLKEIEVYNDILLVRDYLKELGKCSDGEGQEVLEFINTVLDEMIKAIIYNRKTQFYTMKQELIGMLNEDVKISI